MALKNGTKTTGTTYYNIGKDQTKFPVAITVTPVVLAGKVVGTIKVFRDITYEREIDKAKTEFVSLASHQLRTPLSTVNWYAEMLLEGDVGELNGKQKKYLDEVYRSNRRMVELVNALLDVSSLELGTFVIEPIQMDICKLSEDVVHEQKPQIAARNIRFTFSMLQRAHTYKQTRGSCGWSCKISCPIRSIHADKRQNGIFHFAGGKEAYPDQDIRYRLRHPQETTCQDIHQTVPRRQCARKRH